MHPGSRCFCCKALGNKTASSLRRVMSLSTACVWNSDDKLRRRGERKEKGVYDHELWKEMETTDFHRNDRKHPSPTLCLFFPDATNEQRPLSTCLSDEEEEENEIIFT